MLGCLKSIVGKGVGLILLVMAAYAGWQWGPEFFPKVHDWLGLTKDGASEEIVATAELADSVMFLVQEFRDGDGPDQVALGSAELTSILRYSVPGLIPGGMSGPEVRLSEGRIHVRARVALVSFPDLPDLGPLIGMLPDTLDVGFEASLMPFGERRAALLVHAVEASRIPLPGRMIPEILKAMGRTDEPGLPPEALLVSLPAGLGSAYILTDSLILSHNP